MRISDWSSDVCSSDLFTVLKTVAYVPHAELTATSQIIETGQVMVFLGDHFVVTVRHGEHGELTQLREQLERDPDMLAKGSSAVLYSVSDHIVDNYVAVAEQLEDDITAIEAEVFSDRRSEEHTSELQSLMRISYAV